MYLIFMGGATHARKNVPYTYCKIFFVYLNFVGGATHENFLTMKISQSTVHDISVCVCERERELGGGEEFVYVCVNFVCIQTNNITELP